VLIRPGMAAFQPAALIALGAAVFGAFEVIFIKQLAGKADGGGEPPVRILFVNNSIGAAVAVGVALTVWQWPTPEQWMLLAAIGVVMVTAQSLFIQAMKRADASYVIPFFYAALVFAALYDAAVFGVIPVPLSILGAALIVTGAIVLVWRERVNRSAEEYSRSPLPGFSPGRGTPHARCVQGSRELRPHPGLNPGSVRWGRAPTPAPAS
jgi:drug/metabolite transporter (DMT)-like permease